MAEEIELKFRYHGSLGELEQGLGQSLDSYDKETIQQGYTFIDKTKERRIRHIWKENGSSEYRLTFKRKPKNKSTDGSRRFEKEYSITEEKFDALSQDIVGDWILKTRYKITDEYKTFEIDVFFSLSRERIKGIMDSNNEIEAKEFTKDVLVEIEFPNNEALQKFQPPAWLREHGEDVTNNPAYKNQRIAMDGFPEPSILPE